MSLSIQSVTNNVTGYKLADGRSFPCSGIPGKAIRVSSLSSYNYNKKISGTEFAPLKCSSRGKFLVCNAGTNGYRRNPEPSRQNKFSRNRNRQNEERENSDSFEEPEVFSSRNGPLLPMSGAPRFQATATPGPREKEIVELFRKVQAQLRERAAVKEEKKREELPGQGKESETVDSLLKLLRKHTTQQGKKSSNNIVSKDFIVDQSKQNGAFGGDKSSISLDLGNNGKAVAEELEHSSFSRPVSNFRRRSPVPKVKFQPFDSDSVTETYIGPRIEANEDDEPDIEIEPKLAIEPVIGFSDDVDDEFDEISEDDNMASDDENNYSDDNEEDDEEEDEEEEEEEEEDDEVPTVVIDYNAMKLTELRVLAKSRGVKRFSKLKKADLLELLSRGSM